MRLDHIRITPGSKSLENLKRQFERAAYMGGTHVEYYSIKQKAITTVSSEYFEWEDPIEIDIIYDKRPKVSLLKRLNWFTEDKDIQPQLMYLPLEVEGKPLTVRRGDLIKVTTGINEGDDNLFQVSVVNSDLVPIYFICNIVPYRAPEQPAETPTVNNKWLNV